MPETKTPHESKPNDPGLVVVGFGQSLDTYYPDSSETPTPVKEPAEVNPVSWDSPHDQKNPQNWPASRKWLIMSVNAIITVNVYVLRVSVVSARELTTSD